jgi:penicillin-binding protein 2
MKGMALNASIGQGDVNVTPLQLAVVYSAISNGGDVLQPQIVKRIESPDGALVEEFAPRLTRHVELTPEQRRVLVDALKGVVNQAGGTGFRARLPDVVVAGKTGTAQVMRLGQVRLKAAQLDYWQRDHAWFASFAPADDPEITIVVLSEHSGFGGTASAPAAAALFRRYFDLKKTDGQAFGGVAAVRVEAPPPAPPVPPRPPRDSLATQLAVAPAADAGLPRLAGPELLLPPDGVAWPRSPDVAAPPGAEPEVR